MVELCEHCHWKPAPAQELSTPLSAIECARCHALLPFDVDLQEHAACDDHCADCERRTPEHCAACRSEWLLANPSFEYLCTSCRAVLAPVG